MPSFHYDSYLWVNWFRCEGMPPLHCEPTLEEVASVDSTGGVGAFSWEAPKDTPSSLLEELAATIRENGKCMGRCTIESKNDRGNIISSLHSVLMIFVSSLSMWSTFNLLEHKSLKKWLIFVSASHIPFDNKSRKDNGMSVCINTWQSWLFFPYNLHSSILTSLNMFEACPSGKRRLLSHL